LDDSKVMWRKKHDQVVHPKQIYNLRKEELKQ